MSEQNKLKCLLLCIILVLPGVKGVCQSNTSNWTYFPKEEWRTASPRSQGLDNQKIDKFIDDLKDGKILKPVSSVTIIKNGYLILHETFGNYNSEQAHTLQSVTKSITSTLVGVAIQNGFIEDLDQKILDFFPEYDEIDNMDANKEMMNLEHALTMRTGQAWTGESHLDALNRYSGDKMKYVLDYRMETQPGQKWYYNSGIAILLGGLIQNATGMDTKDFAEDYLFNPMGIESARWSWSHRGIPHTGGGLYLKPTDMARIGYLYLRNGNWDGRQIVPKWWVEEATTRHVMITDIKSGKSNISYGYMWWLMSMDRTKEHSEPTEIFMAYGHWGQFIFVIPKYDMVIAWTNNSSATYPEEKEPINLIYEYILPAVIN